jgi:hypothetical protein
MQTHRTYCMDEQWLLHLNPSSVPSASFCTRALPTRFRMFRSLHALPSMDGLEVAIDRLEATTNGVLEEHVVRARPSPYAKR